MGATTENRPKSRYGRFWVPHLLCSKLHQLSMYIICCVASQRCSLVPTDMRFVRSVAEASTRLLWCLAVVPFHTLPGNASPRIRSASRAGSANEWVLIGTLQRLDLIPNTACLGSRVQCPKATCTNGLFYAILKWLSLSDPKTGNGQIYAQL